MLLIEGNVEIISPRDHQPAIISSLLPGEILDELEVLSHGKQAGKIVAKTTPTKILAIAVDTFDGILEEDHDFSRRILGSVFYVVKTYFWPLFPIKISELHQKNS